MRRGQPEADSMIELMPQSSVKIQERKQYRRIVHLQHTTYMTTPFTQRVFALHIFSVGMAP